MCEPEHGLPVSHDRIAGAPALKANADDLARTVVTPHPEHEINGKRNVLWCATFQLAWDELWKLAGGEVRMQDAPPAVAALNRSAMSRYDLDENSYVAAAGVIGDGILARIRRELDRKFAGAASPSLLEDGAQGDGPIAYAYLFKHLPFEVSFFREPADSLLFGDAPVQCFGIRGSTIIETNEEKMLRQVLVHDRRSDDDFVIELKTTAKDDRLILAKVPPVETLAETVAGVRKRAAGVGLQYLQQCEEFLVPVLDFDVRCEYRELCGLPVIAPASLLHGLPMVSALQDVRFRLDEKGAVLKSEAGAFMAGVPRSFVFDRPFLILLERRGAANPYFALWVANAELLLPLEKRTNGGGND